MYEELFQLNEPPFQLTPDPQFLFASPQHARAKAYMESTIVLADGFVVLTGEIGCGKTTLIESFIADLPDNIVLAQITQTQLSPVEFLQAILVELGFRPFKMRKIELLTQLKNFLVEQYAEGKQMLLIVDEAQNLSRRVLEEIRLLSGIEAQKEKVLRIVLAGQPELSKKLDSPRLEQLSQRVRLRFHIAPLSKKETRAYIQHRLDIAGADGREIFDEEAMDVVFRYAGGVPRLVNILCDTAMLCAFSEDEPTVTRRFVEAAVEELQWLPYADRVGERVSAQSQAKRLEVLRTPMAKLDAALEEFQDPSGKPKAPRTKAAQVATDPNAAPLAKLEVLRPGEGVSTYDLMPGRIIIGRTSDNDVQIQSSYISRHHAQILTDQTESVLQDLNSTNGVSIGGEKVRRHRLNDGDLILLGEHHLLYTDLRVPPSEEGGEPMKAKPPKRATSNVQKRPKPKRKRKSSRRKPWR